MAEKEKTPSQIEDASDDLKLSVVVELMQLLRGQVSSVAEAERELLKRGFSKELIQHGINEIGMSVTEADAGQAA